MVRARHGLRELASHTATSELKRFSAGDPDTIVLMSDKELVLLAIKAASELKTKAPELQELIFGGMRLLRLRYLREWLNIWAEAGGVVPEHIRRATDNELLTMPPEQIYAVKVSVAKALSPKNEP